MSERTSARVYLAGPDLFYPDAQERYDRLRHLCARHGLIGVAPTDDQNLLVENTPACAQRLYEANMATLSTCAAVLANLSHFQGLEPDSGTVYEFTVADVRGMPLAAYVGDGRSLLTRTRSARRVFEEQPGVWRDEQTWAQIEDFGLPLNLMLASRGRISATPEQDATAMALAMYRSA